MRRSGRHSRHSLRRMQYYGDDVKRETSRQRRTASPVACMSCESARRMFLGAQGLLDDPQRSANRASVARLIKSLGFVQIDSINYVERAHHLTLGARLDAYQPSMLHQLIEKDRALFEHWTHDASAIPCEWLSHWHHRFDRFLERAERSTWWKARLGSDPFKVMRHVRERIEKEGPLRSRDFLDENSRPSQPWWGWRPQKVALEVLWRIGELAITRRENFEKVYDLTHRVLPELHGVEKSSDEAHVEWACSTALDRLGAATPTELAAFWNAISAAECRAWCTRAAQEGRIVPVDIDAADGSRPTRAYAPHDWRERIAALPQAPDRARLLCPFDPVIRDRKRLLRLFDFDYRFEAFVPAPKRVHGYYVMPILEGERLIGRIDPKFDRMVSTLHVRAIWWQPGIRATRKRSAALEEAVNQLALLIGADHFEFA